MAKILWLSGEYLLPADSGLYRYSLDMLNALRGMGHKVRAIGRARTPEAVLEAHAEDWWRILPHRQPPMAKKMVFPAPAKVIEVWDEDYSAAVQSEMTEYAPEIILFDHLRSGAALEVIGDSVPTIYLSQNDETQVKRKMIPAANGIRKAALLVDLIKMARFENRLLHSCDGVSAISTDDISTFEARHPRGPIVHTLPTYLGTRKAHREITDATPRRVAIISTLYWGAKIDNLVMALSGLQPLLDGPDPIELVVFTGGYLPPESIQEQYPTVRFEGFVEDFDSALSECRIGVVFEPVGGGFKIKTLDFIFHRVPLVVGHTSAMSLPLVAGESVERVTDQHQLAPLIRSLIDDLPRLNAMQDAAFAACEDLFTSETARPLSDLINQLVGSQPRPESSDNGT